MGKGDKKTKRGKIVLGSYGVRRKRKANKAVFTKVDKEAKKVAKKVVKEVEIVEDVKPAEEKKTKTPKKTAAPKKKEVTDEATE
jgi:ribosomal small subunit protein bTHX